MTVEQKEQLDDIYKQVSSAHTALVMLSEGLTKLDFDRLHKAHDFLIEAEIELCLQLIKS